MHARGKRSQDWQVGETQLQGSSQDRYTDGIPKQSTHRFHSVSVVRVGVNVHRVFELDKLGHFA